MIKKIIYIIITACSAFSFLFLFILNDFEELHSYIYALIISSLIYKLIYLICNDNYPLLLDIVNKIDYICILNLVWKHCYKYFFVYDLYIYNFIVLLSYINCYAFHLFLVFLYFLTFINLLNKDKILSFFYILSGFFIAQSYYSFTQNGWNIINSWCWHLSSCMCILSVKISYMK